MVCAESVEDDGADQGDDFLQEMLVHGAGAQGGGDPSIRGTIGVASVVLRTKLNGFPTPR